MPGLKAVLFDHDGTLVDSERLHFEMWHNILEAYGINLGINEYEQHYAGIPTITNAGKILDRYPALTMSESSLIRAKNSATRAFLSEQAFPLMSGARESLDYFRDRQLGIAIVTGAGIEGVEATVKAYTLHEHVTTVVSGEDVTSSKPAPDCYLLALQRLQLDPADCIAIEDTVNGVTAATKAGIPCLLVASSISKNHDFSNASASFASLDEAKNWISCNYKFIPDAH